MCCIEILILWRLGTWIANICRSKGRSPTGWVMLLILLFFGGEFFGAFAGVILAGAEEKLAAYGFGIAGAVIGIVITFVIVNNLPSLRRDEDYYRRDYYGGRRSVLPADDYREKFGEFREKDQLPPRDPDEGDQGWYRREEQ